ncbi:unnamed protein product [Moneuplotes crassus]|uniref:Uncharacterized protein n=1 Tax=Euplotes crassus TaxID=5936 RepID=A0AAD2D696_EUPCR|nr:unnamed protein product [Moneuplotes crassus]
MSGTSGISRYYMVITIFFIFLAVMCIVFNSSYGGQVCGKDESTLTSMPATLIALYFVMAALSLIAALLLNRFLVKTPDDFASLGFCDKILGCTLKLIPGLQVLLHYIMAILIIIQWIQILLAGCSDSYGTNALILNCICTFFFCLIHCGGAYIKGIIYQDPFLYRPDEPETSCMGIMCRKLGP